MSVQIQFDKPRELKFTLRAVKELEANMGGLALGEVFRQLSNFGITALTTALYVGLKHEDKTLNQNLVTKMLEDYLDTGGRVKPLMEGVSEALEATGLFKTDEDEDDEGNAKPGPVDAGH